jgi:hypothetical protein
MTASIATQTAAIAAVEAQRSRAARGASATSVATPFGGSGDSSLPGRCGSTGHAIY